MNEDRRSFLKKAALAAGALILAPGDRAKVLAEQPTEEALKLFAPKEGSSSWYDMALRATVHCQDSPTMCRKEWIGDNGHTLKLEYVFKVPHAVGPDLTDYQKHENRLADPNLAGGPKDLDGQARLQAWRQGKLT